jgi:hypothetical protein
MADPMGIRGEALSFLPDLAALARDLLSALPPRRRFSSFGPKKEYLRGQIVPTSLGDGDDEIINPCIAIVGDVRPAFQNYETHPGHADLQGQTKSRQFSA